MTYATSIINPYFAARFKRIALAPRPEPAPRRQPEQPVYAKLPRAPINASPVPRYTRRQTGSYHDYCRPFRN